MSASHSRRQFLKYSSGLALSQLPWLSGCVTTPLVTTESSVDPKAWQELADHLKGPLLRPGSQGFDALAGTWNLRYKKVQKPAGIARCKSVADVQACLQWAQAHKLPLVARSGGHSYAGYSTTPGLMIELKLMDGLEYDIPSGRATTGGGARNLTLYKGLPSRHCAVTHGRCSSVGVGGLVLAGGIGFNMRRHGLLIDQLLETQMVTASGQVLRCNAHENARLFWACRGGGGGNFGINTSFTFQTFPVKNVTVFDLTWTTNLDELLPAALDLLPATTDRLGCKLSVFRKAGGALGINLLGQLVGEVAEVRKLLAPLYRIAAPAEIALKSVDYWDAQTEYLGEDGSPEYSHERSRYAYRPFSAACCRTILKHMRAWPGTHAGTSWKMFLTGGAIARVAPDATAYCHRAAIAITSMELNWHADDTPQNLAVNEAWLNRFHAAMAEHTSHECYQNFIDNSEKHYLRAYYGKNLEGLVKVKHEIDPGNVFRYPQSIPVRL